MSRDDPSVSRSSQRSAPAHPLVAPAYAAFRADPLLRPHAAFAFELQEGAAPSDPRPCIQDRRLRRAAVLDTLPPAEQTPERRRLFLRHAQILSRLDHPAIPAVYEYGRSPTGDLYLLTKLIRGETLAARLRSHDLRRRPAAALPAFLNVLLRACEALACAHERSIIHRRLAPEHIILGRHGEVFIRGWSLARDREEPLDKDRGLRRSLAGLEPAEREYIAPEVLEKKEVDGRADIYSIGAILQAALADASSPLAALASSCLAAEPERRPRDARSLAQALRSLLSKDRRPPRLNLTIALLLFIPAAIALGAALTERALSRSRHAEAAALRRREHIGAADAKRQAASRLADLLRRPDTPAAPPASPASLDDTTIKRRLLDAALRERREGPKAALGEVDAILDRAPRSARALFFRAGVYARLGQHKKAVADFTAVIEIQPQQYGAHVNRALSKVELRDFDGALADFGLAIAASHKLEETYNNRGICKRSMGNIAAAIRDYDRAIEANPRFAKPYNNRALARAFKGEHALALQDYDRALDLAPGDAAFLNNRAKSFISLRRIPEARADLEQILAADPKNSSALITLSGIALQGSDYPEAIARARAALQIDPGSSRARTNLAIALSFQGEHAPAIAEADRVIARIRDDFRAHYARGRSARALGRKEKALEDLQRVRSLAPAFRSDEIQAWIRELEAGP